MIVASERAARPSDFSPRIPATAGIFCPFCPGNEEATPQELLSRRAPDAGPGDPRWSVRVFPNRFPALRVEGELLRSGEGLFDRISGVGAHEVIVETPRHDTSLAQLSIPSLAEVLRAWRDRIVDLGRDLRLTHVSVFKNQGPAAGATLAHEHSQLLALPTLPRDVALELERAEAWFSRKERCVSCDLIRQERAAGARLVFEDQRFVVLCPWASPTPFLLWILPKNHASHFEAVDDPTSTALAEVLRLALGKLERALEGPAYNLVLVSGRLRGASSPASHWRLEIAPALTVPGGFERASGCYINSTRPEDAAAFLRGIDPA